MEIGKGRAYTTSTIQNIASVSKTVTATAIMQLVERGALDLDADASEYLGFRLRHPDHPDTVITPRMLLSHQGSIKDGMAYDTSYACGDPTQSLEAWLHACFVEGESGTHFHRHAPGEKHRYSNVGYGLLGHIVGQASGMSFPEWCREHIFSPLEMVHTGWSLAEIDTDEHATPHTYLKRLPSERRRGRHPMIKTWPEAAPGFAAYCLYSFPNYPDGLLRTSVSDFARFLAAFAGGGAPLLKADTVKEMLEAQCEASDAPGHFQALCWVGSEDEAGRTRYHHSGGDPGVSTLAMFRPADKRWACAFANSESEIPVRVVLSHFGEGE
jgi:CubicO group peptidase (beta-lactamase class C family)